MLFRRRKRVYLLFGVLTLQAPDGTVSTTGWNAWTESGDTPMRDVHRRAVSDSVRNSREAGHDEFDEDTVVVLHWSVGPALVRDAAGRRRRITGKVAELMKKAEDG